MSANSTIIDGLNLIYYCNPNYTLRQLLQYNLAYCISSMMTFLPTAAILVAVFFYRAYHSILQRLFIYLTLTIMVYLFISSLNLQLRPQFFDHTTGNTFCMWTGYMQTTTHVCSLLLSFEISIYLLYIMHYQVRGKPIPVPNSSQTVILELGAIFFAVILPLGLLAIPIRNYGVGGAVCWIRIYEGTDCEVLPASKRLGVALFTTYTLIVSINLIVFMALVVIFCCLACKFQQSRASHLKTARRTLLLFILLITYTVIHLSSILIQYYVINNKIIFQRGELIVCIVTPISQIIQPLAYMFYLNSVKKFRWDVAKSTAGEWRESWRFCCMHFNRILRGHDGTMMINNLDTRSGEYLTPSIATSSHYESMR